MKRKLTRGSTGVVVPVLLQDTSRTDGSGLTGVTYNSPGLTARWKRSDQTDWQPLTLVAGVVGTWVGSATSAGFVPLPSGRGACELSLPNEALAAGTWTIVQLYGAANMADINLEIELDAVGYQDAVRFGLLALPNAASGAPDGLPTVEGSGGSGLTAQEVWTYDGPRTLTQTAAQLATIDEAGTVTLTRGVTIAIPFTDVPNLANRAKLWFTVKKRLADEDPEGVIQIEETAGLLYQNGSAANGENGAAASTDGALVVDAEANAVTVTLTLSVSAELPIGNNFYYDLKVLTTGGQIPPPPRGRLNVVSAVTRAVS